MKFYKDKTNPLEEVTLSNMEHNHIYINDEGMRIVYKEESDGGTQLLVIQHSELNMGENVADLTDKQLKLYWTLMENKKEGKIG